ncbi:MAG: sulfatase-like hydrolase/transferase [Terrimonas sp.]|nr:sulfatase-like hydrolase/transferase [Terrimonas sp.]
MKNYTICVILLMTVYTPIREKQIQPAKTIQPAENLFIITTDGFRWQELFLGADSLLINDASVTPDAETMKMLYWDEQPEKRRKMLMPFFWKVVAGKGQVFGNRFYDNKVNVANIYSISYPGYHEIFTGKTGLSVASNDKIFNNNTNVLTYLNETEKYKGKVVAFTSWDVFPYILNEKENGFPVNSGYESMEAETAGASLINEVQASLQKPSLSTRHDRLTFLAAREYLEQHQPKVMFLGLGETDEFAHQSRYDLYLEQAHAVDGMIAELWHWIQTTPGYKDNTTMIITTDHGRGRRESKWSKHGMLVGGSSETWMAIVGPHIQPAGEIKQEQQLFQKQIAQTIAELLGEEFQTDHAVAKSIPLH